jgi:hypothetical protein
MHETFRVFFNRKKQFFDVFIWNVHPNTFHTWKAGRWGYYLDNIEHPRRGKFGEIHLVKSRIRPDLVSHELDHLRMKWYFVKWIIITPNNEEKFCIFGDELTRRFWREYNKHQKRTNQL